MGKVYKNNKIESKKITKKTNKKVTILYVLKILKECSSVEHPVSQLLITRTINLAGIPCDRKTISRDIECLKEFGYKIVKLSGGGCYLRDNEEKFTVQNYRLIAGCINASNLESDEKIKLCNKLKNLINIIEY